MSPDEPFLPGHAQAFILAGGQSRRMGSDKARLAWNGRPLVHTIRDAIAPCVAHVWLVCKADSGCEDLGIPVLYDRDSGPALVHGLRAALGAPGPPWRFVLGCDMPGVDRELLAALWRTAHTAGAPGSYPSRQPDGLVEPLPSLWNSGLVPHPAPAWGLGARDWVRHAGLAAWPVPRRAESKLANVNTPAEWKEWQCRARAGP